MEHIELLSRLWLHEPSAADVERAVNELGLPRPTGNNPAAELAEAYANLFLLNVFPYGSAFTDPDGELNAASARLAARAFEEQGFAPRELAEVAAADHLGLCISFLGDEKHQTHTGETESDYDLLKRDFDSWAPVCCLAVEREPAVHPFYRALAERTRNHVLENVPWVFDRRMETLDSDGVSDQPALGAAESHDDGVRLSDIVRFLLAPRRCGLFLSRARLGRIAMQLGSGIRLPFGTRYEVARNLFVSAGEAEMIEPLFDHLETEIAEWERLYQSLEEEHPAWGMAALTWRHRTQRASQWLATLRAAAVHNAEGDVPLKGVRPL